MACGKQTRDLRGSLALGAHLFPAPSDSETDKSEIAPIFNKDPKIPILFVAGIDESTSSLSYAAATENSGDSARGLADTSSGHVNVNSEERLSAMRALVAWSEGTPATDIDDATIIMAPESIAEIRGGTVSGTVTRIRPLYGNIYIDIVAGDLDAIDISLGDKFSITVNEQSFPITFAKAYSDVPIGEWVAFIDPEGHVQVSRNYANAAETAEASKGMAIRLSNNSGSVSRPISILHCRNVPIIPSRSQFLVKNQNQNIDRYDNRRFRPRNELVGCHDEPCIRVF